MIRVLSHSRDLSPKVRGLLVSLLTFNAWSNQFIPTVSHIFSDVHHNLDTSLLQNSMESSSTINTSHHFSRDPPRFG
jgi:hypothetical protein